MGRYFVGAVAGAVVTVALMYLMQALIFTDTDLIPDDMPVPDVDILREVPEEPQPPERPTLPPRPTEDDIPPEMEQMEPAPVTGTGGNPYTIPEPETGVGGGVISIPTVLMPLVRVEPEYPRSAITRGTEGYAVVGFTVAADGTTSNIEVLASEPGNTFDSAATRAVAGWIYQPQSDEAGNPIAVPGQTARFDFNFNDGAED